MIENNDLIVVAERYYVFLKIGYIELPQFLTRINTLLDVLDYSETDITAVRVKIQNIRRAGMKYTKH